MGVKYKFEQSETPVELIKFYKMDFVNMVKIDV